MITVVQTPLARSAEARQHEVDLAMSTFFDGWLEFSMDFAHDHDAELVRFRVTRHTRKPIKETFHRSTFVRVGPYGIA